MEVTNGLLSKLVHTKAIESVLAPIASQISLLIILDESDGGRSGPCEMGPCAETVMKAAESLIQVGKERAKQSKDQDYRKQMLSACEILDLASGNLFIASQRLATHNSKENRTKIVSSAKDVLQGTMKVLLVSDDAEVRKIVSAANLVTENVQRLGRVEGMPELLTNFKSFTDSAGLLGTLVNRRQKELCHERQREKVIVALSVLQKCIPSMSVALQSFIKYPHNPQAQVGKSYVMNQVLSAVRELVEAVENSYMEEDNLEEEGPGFFVTKIDQLLDALSVENRGDMRRDLDVWTEASVRHSMLVAHLCTDQSRDGIIKTCHRILQLKTNIIRLFYETQQSPELDSVRQEYDTSCETLIDEFCELEKIVNMSLLNLVVDVFKESSEPLERLVKASMSELEVSATDVFSDYVSEFEDHAEKMCQVGNLAAASSTDAQRVRIIRTCVYRLEKLDPDIIPATVAMTKHPSDKMAVKHVKLLMKEWNLELSKLLQALDEMTDPAMFMQISESNFSSELHSLSSVDHFLSKEAEKKIEQDVATCHSLLSRKDVGGVASVTHSMIGRSRRVCQMAERIISSHSDPIYRNGLLVYIKQLQKVIPGVKVASSNVVNSMSNTHFVETLHHRLTQLLDRVKQVREGLSEDRQPHILSEQRRNIRQSAMCNIKPRLSKSTSQQVASSQVTYPHSKFSQSLSQLGNLPIIPHSMAATYPTMQSHPRNPVEEPVQQSSASQKLMSSRVMKSQKSSSDFTTESGKLTRRILQAVSCKEMGEAELVLGEMLGWSSHIEDSGRAVAKYASSTKERTMLELCDTIHDLVCTISEKCGLENPEFAQHCHQWNTQVERLRVYIDAMISEQKEITDKMCDAAISKNRKLLTSQVELLKEHKRCICEVVGIVEEFDELDSPACVSYFLLSRLRENGEELDNITVTIVTTTEMVALSGDGYEMCQLEQLGREWAVTAYSILQDLDRVAAKSLTLGQERRVWVWSGEKSKTEEYVVYMEQENKRYKRLLHCACMGNEEKSRTGQDLCVSMCESYDLITSAVAMERSWKEGRGQPVGVLYISRKTDVIIAGWILKAVECLDLIRSQVDPYTAPVDSLVEKASVAASKTSEKDKQTATSNLNSHISQFSENLVKLRQKALGGIQLSTEIEKRSMVRKCLDQLTELSPKLIELLKAHAAAKGDVTEDEVHRSMQDWSVKLRQVVSLIQQMKDVRPTLVKDLGKIMGVEVPSQSESGADYRDTLAGNAQPSGSLSPNISPRGHREGRKEVRSMRDNMHAELLQATKNRDPEVGQVPPRRSKKESPYKPSSSILDAAHYLQQEADKWEDECNPVVQVAKAMSNQMKQMSDCCKGEEHEEAGGGHELTSISHSLAENGEKMRQFAKVLAKCCIDKRAGSDLELYSNQIQIYCKQLSILSSVQMSSEPSTVTDKILMQNAQNLMKVVKQTMKAAETACVKGLDVPDNGTEDETCALLLATQWKRKLDRHRRKELSNPQRDDLGLRRIERDTAPQLEQIFSRK